jgi:Methyltransferase domain
MADNLGQLYDPPFFQAQSLNSLQSARTALPELFRHFRPKNVVDVGCGVGAWLCAAGELGVVECLGIDGGYVDRGALLIPEEAFVPVDLAAPGLSDAVATRRPGRFDLVMCLEVAEHLPFERSAGLVEELCQLGDMVLFSAAIPFQYGTGHINEQWPEFWAMQFRARDYICFDLMRAFLWAQPELDWWYAQNLLVFAREGSAAHGRLPSAAAAGNRALSLVHPKAWLSSILNHWRPHRAAARQEEMEDLGTLLRAWVGNAAMPAQLCAIERARAGPPDARNVFPFTRTEIASPEHLIAQAQAALAAAEERVATGERELAATRSDLAQAQTEAAAIREDLAWEQTEAAAIREELAARQIVVESLHAAMEQARAAETALETELHGLHSRAETLRAANTTLRGHVQQRETALAKAAERAKALQDDFARREQELQDGFVRREQELQDGFVRREQELRDELLRLRQKIAQVRSSISWRITKPLRALHRLLRLRS